MGWLTGRTNDRRRVLPKNVLAPELRSVVSGSVGPVRAGGGSGKAGGQEGRGARGRAWWRRQGCWRVGRPPFPPCRLLGWWSGLAGSASSAGRTSVVVAAGRLVAPLTA
jgi:hypothetical protein